MEVLEINEIRLFGLMAVFSSITIGKGSYLAKGGSEKPPHDQAPVF